MFFKTVHLDTREENIRQVEQVTSNVNWDCRDRYARFVLRPDRTECVEIIIDKTNTEVYYLNDSGKTMEAFRWSGWRDRKTTEHQPPPPGNIHSRFVYKSNFAKKYPECQIHGLVFQQYAAGSDVGGFIGWYEPKDKSWILFVDKDNVGYMYLERDPKTGAVIN